MPDWAMAAMVSAATGVEAIKRALRCGKSGCPCQRSANVHCPTHADPSPSLTVHEGSDGKALVNCKGGCDQTRVIAKLKEMNLWPKLDDDRKSDRPEGGERLVAQYEYRTADGALVAIKGRFEREGGGKSFKWKLPASPTWAGLEGMPQSELPLWGAELLGIAGPEERVYVVEGEKAAMACRAVGLLAVTHSGGAGATQFGASLDLLRGRNVVLWPDNDDAGRKLMDRIRTHIRPIARSVVTIFPSVPEKGDAVEYFGGGNTLEQLAAIVPPPPRPIMEILDQEDDAGCIFARRGLGYHGFFTEQGIGLTIDHLRRSSGELRGEVLVESALPTIPSHLFWGGLILSSGSNREKLAKILESRTKGLGIDWDAMIEVMCRKVALSERQGEPFTTAGDMAPTAQTDWLISGFAPRLEPTTIFGRGGAGKSLLTLALGISVMAGTEIVPGFSPALKGNVLYLDWEASRQRLDSRIKRICRGAGIAPLVMSYRRCIGPLLDQVEDVLRYCQSEGIVLVLVDSMEMAMNGTGGEGSDPNEKVIRIHSALRLLGTTSVLIDHVNAASLGQGKPAEKPIGGMFKLNLARMAFELRKSEGLEKPGEVSIGLFNVKRNDDGPMLRPVGFRVIFGDDGTVTYEREDKASEVAGLSVRARIIAVLKRYGSLTQEGISRETGLPWSALKMQFKRLRDAGQVQQREIGDYALVSQQTEPEEDGQDEIPF